MPTFIGVIKHLFIGQLKEYQFFCYFRQSVVSVVKHSLELKTDFECSRSKVEICYKSQQDFASQKG